MLLLPLEMISEREMLIFVLRSESESTSIAVRHDRKVDYTDGEDFLQRFSVFMHEEKVVVDEMKLLEINPRMLYIEQGVWERSSKRCIRRLRLIYGRRGIVGFFFAARRSRTGRQTSVALFSLTKISLHASLYATQPGGGATFPAAKPNPQQVIEVDVHLHS